MKNIIIKSLLLLMTFVPTMNVMAQEKKSFTLEDLLPGGNNYDNLLPANKSYQWWGYFACLEMGKDKIEGIWVGDKTKKEGKTFPVITLEETNNLLADKELGNIATLQNAVFPYNDFEKAVNMGLVQVNKFPKLMLVNTTTHKVLIDWGKKDIVWSQPRTPKAANQDWSKESRSLAYTIDNNLFVTTADGKELQVTDEPKGIVCGQAVHRQEFGITKGTFWSPEGNLLAFYRMDETMVTDYPQVNTSTRIATLEPDKYPMAGMTSHKVTVGIYNPANQQTVYLKAGDPTDRYFTNISWTPDGKSIYVIELNRDQNHAQLVCYNALTGEKEGILYEETHSKYVEPMHPVTFLPWDHNKFIYQSQRDGFNHLYLFDTQTKVSPELRQTAAGGEYREYTKVQQLTQGEWLVQDIVGFNTLNKEVIIKSTEISPLQSNIFSVNIKNGKRYLIGEKDANHSVVLSGCGRYVVDSYTSSTNPRTIRVLPTFANGIGSKTDITLLQATNPMEAYNMPEITVGTIKAADEKTDLYYRLIKPVNFDPNKKYPAVIYVYGGPHAQLIHNTRNYDARGWDIYMAQLGYVMLTVDNRGSDNRGQEFENCTFRQLGTEEMKDQIKGVDFLKSLGYVDNNRIGVHGWSFGGFMTTNLMLTYPDIFKVGVAGGPVIDWEYYEVMYGERYMDTPQSNPEGYKKANLKLRAVDLKGRLEIIIGANDPTCVPQHSVSFLRACINAGTQPDFFMYPGDGHNMFGRDRVHLYERITRYFEDHLKK